MNRIAERGIMTHLQECECLTKLMLDLKKRELGREHGPITIERLDEANVAISKIMACRQKGIWR